MFLTVVLAALAVVSLSLLAWQVIAASGFVPNIREAACSFQPAVILLKPLKGCDEHTEPCLRSWFVQRYRGKLRILFGVADSDDPVRAVVQRLMAEFPAVDARLLSTPDSLGPNAKISNVAQLCNELTRGASDQWRNAVLCLSDADVWAPDDFLANAVAPLQSPEVGLVTSFYQLANPQNFAMQLEAVAINADFWSQVLQSNALKRQDFALGAVMITWFSCVEQIGGFGPLTEFLADDYQLGNRIARLGRRIALAKLVVQCRDPLLTLRDVWQHQLRWARTIRASQPLPYFFSILSNVTVWVTAFAFCAACLGIYRVAPRFPWHVDGVWIVSCAAVWAVSLTARIAAARHCARRLTGRPAPWSWAAAVPAKDLLQAAVWAGAFLGNTVKWRGRTFRLVRGGKLVEQVTAPPAGSAARTGSAAH